MHYSHKTLVCNGNDGQLAATFVKNRRESGSSVVASGVGTFSLLQLLRLLRLLGHQSGLVREWLAHQAIGSGVGGWQGGREGGEETAGERR